MNLDFSRYMAEESDEDFSEEQLATYQEQLIDRFTASPEGQTLLDAGYDLSWSPLLLEYGTHYLGVTPAGLTPDGLEEILYDIFPRKVSATAESSPEIVREFRVFLQFLNREFNLANVEACLNILDERSVQRFKREMANPAKFGMAKSMVMQGIERGYDVSTDEGLNEWMAVNQAESLLGLQEPTGNLASFGGSSFPERSHNKPSEPGNSAKLRQKEKARRKMAKASRRKNRH